MSSNTNRNGLSQDFLKSEGRSKSKISQIIWRLETQKKFTKQTAYGKENDSESIQNSKQGRIKALEDRIQIMCSEAKTNRENIDDVELVRMHQDLQWQKEQLEVDEWWINYLNQAIDQLNGNTEQTKVVDGIIKQYAS
tara:strand:+ start:100 stop:513 length:414 start_codon:yes stop_codon:yes gene_type:complete